MLYKSTAVLLSVFVLFTFVMVKQTLSQESDSTTYLPLVSSSDKYVAVADVGAKCDATYDINLVPPPISGSDDTEAIRQAIQKVSLVGGGTIVFPPGLCRTTSTIVITSTNIRLVGVGAFGHPESHKPSSAILFDPIEKDTSTPSSALIIRGEPLPTLNTGQGFRMENFGVITRNKRNLRNTAIYNSIVITSGAATLVNTKLMNLDGSRPGCAIVASDYGTGLLLLGSQSQIRLWDSYVSGYNIGVDAQKTAAFSVIGSELMGNAFNLKIGDSANANIDHNIMQDAVQGNITITQGSAIGIRNNYFESGTPEGCPGYNSYNLSVGSTTSSTDVKNVVYDNNYLACNPNPTKPAIVLNRVTGFHAEDNVFASCTQLPIIQNRAASGVVAQATLKNSQFIGNHGTYLDSYQGVVFDDSSTTASTFYNLGVDSAQAGYGGSISYRSQGTAQWIVGTDAASNFSFVHSAHSGETALALKPFGGSPFSSVLVDKSIASGLNTTTSKGGAVNFDAGLGNSQKLVLTENVGSSQLINANAGQAIYFIICQDNIGGRTFVWPPNVKGGMTPGLLPNKCSAQSFIFDGTNAYALSPGGSNLSD